METSAHTPRSLAISSYADRRSTVRANYGGLLNRRRRLLFFAAVIVVGTVMHYAPPDWNPFIVFPGVALEVIGVVGFWVTLVRKGSEGQS